MNENITYTAFTKKNKGKINRLISDVVVKNRNNTVLVQALWDTGATITSISEQVVTDLALKPTGKTTLSTPAGSVDVNTYLVDIILSKYARINDLMVCDSKIGEQGIGVLIGMDIITQGDFAISNFNVNTVFSFRVPSKEVTDYELEIRISNLTGKHGLGKRKKNRNKNK